MPVAGLESFALDWVTPDAVHAFWADVVAELNTVAPEPSRRALAPPAPGLDFWELEFRSIDAAPITAYLLSPHSAGACPLIVHAHGYNAQYDVMQRWAERGCHVLGFDARGFGRSAPACAIAAAGYVITGIESPHTSILRGAVCDYMQAAVVAHELLEGKLAGTSFTGFSFGGALAIMAAGLSPLPDLLVVGQPTFAWTAERRRLSLAGSTAEINRFLDKHPEQLDRVLHTLQYFDTMNFAPLVDAATLVGIGLDDNVVPSRTVIALVNRLTCRHEVRLLPVSHSADPRERLWKQFDDEWLDYVESGLPADFGDAERQIRVIGGAS